MSKKREGGTISLFTAGVITTISITLVLFLLGLTALIGFTAKGFSTYLKENMGISIQLVDNSSDEEIKQIQRELDENPYIKSVRFISREEVKAQLIEDLGRDPEDLLGYDASKPYFDVSIKAEYVNPDSIRVVEASLRDKSIVKNVIYNQLDISNANSNLSTIGSFLLILAIILVSISFTLIRSIIQLNIYSKRFLINTMQLVGATNSFIRRPFVWRMVGCGVLAAILANIAITGVVYYVTTAFPLSISIVSVNELAMVYAIVLVCGIVIAAFATVTAVNKYLRMTSNKMYRI